VKGYLQIALPGALAGEADQVTRTIKPGNMPKTTPGQFERVAPLPAAQIENAIIGPDPGGMDQPVDLVDRIAFVFEHVAVGFEIKRVEQRAPPIRGQMAFEIENRP
jgi:hypothetical protein